MKYTLKDGRLVRLDPFTPDPVIEGSPVLIKITVNEAALIEFLRLRPGGTLEVVGGTLHPAVPEKEPDPPQ